LPSHEFGGFATPERRIVFDINDFDETHPAPWEWDIKRLATSVVIAGNHNRFNKEQVPEGHYAVCKVTGNTCKPMLIWAFSKYGMNG
jgi:uncharacterized protein (DUF2252 family)